MTHLVDSNLPLESKQKFHFGLTRSGQARPVRNFCFDVSRRFESTRCVTLALVTLYKVHVYQTKKREGDINPKKSVDVVNVSPSKLFLFI